jgi:hypothetical protein
VNNRVSCTQVHVHMEVCTQVHVHMEVCTQVLHTGTAHRHCTQALHTGTCTHGSLHQGNICMLPTGQSRSRSLSKCLHKNTNCQTAHFI